MVEPSDANYGLVNAAIERLILSGSTLCYTSQNLAEFWNTCTRPSVRNGFGLTIGETEIRVQAIEDAMQLLPDSEAVHREWRRLIVEYEVSGVQVHDARLVAAMKVHRVRQIVTFNQRDFTRYKDIKAFPPDMI